MLAERAGIGDRRCTSRTRARTHGVCLTAGLDDVMSQSIDQGRTRFDFNFSYLFRYRHALTCTYPLSGVQRGSVFLCPGILLTGMKTGDGVLCGGTSRAPASASRASPSSPCTWSRLGRCSCCAPTRAWTSRLQYYGMAKDAYNYGTCGFRLMNICSADSRLLQCSVAASVDLDRLSVGALNQPEYVFPGDNLMHIAPTSNNQYCQATMHGLMEAEILETQVDIAILLSRICFAFICNLHSRYLRAVLHT